MTYELTTEAFAHKNVIQEDPALFPYRRTLFFPSLNKGVEAIYFAEISGLPASNLSRII